MLVEYPTFAQAKKAYSQSLRAASNIWTKYGHTAVHYSIVPGIFAYGLYQAGELTLDPIGILTKILVP